MTVINNIEIDNITYRRNETREAIINNDPTEEKLHVIAVVSNPCLYAIRYILFREFVKRMTLDESNVILYVVELAYGNQRFLMTDKRNPRHLQIRTTTPIWHKENMVNMGVKKLLPTNWKAMAWIDADVEFENPSWATDTLRILNGSKDIVQVFSHAVDMNKHGEALQIFSGFGYQYTKQNPHGQGVNFWHPGFGWACTRKAYEKMGGLYQYAILGSGDNIMALCLIGQGKSGINVKSTPNYKKSVNDFEQRVRGLRLGYVPGVIRHHYHGAKKNRKYMERWTILVKHDYDPDLHVAVDSHGCLVPTAACPPELLSDIFHYFEERNEDEDFQELRLDYIKPEDQEETRAAESA